MALCTPQSTTMRFHKSTLSIVLLALVAAATGVVAAPLRPQFVPGLTTYALSLIHI